MKIIIVKNIDNLIAYCVDVERDRVFICLYTKSERDIKKSIPLAINKENMA